MRSNPVVDWRPETSVSAGEGGKVPRLPQLSALDEQASEPTGILHQDFKWEALGAVKEELSPEAGVFYHGTYASLLPRILGEGLLPGLGAGSDAVMRHFGLTTPGVYVSPVFETAAQYPMTETTGPITFAGQH